MGKIKDITGQKFGKLTVLEQAGYYTSSGGLKYIQWKCQCDCGNICYIPGKSLKNGKTQSCGCLKREKTTERNKDKAKDLTNLRFGKLIAQYPTEKRASGNYVIWHCKCDCGNECDVASGYLLRGNVKSCGCLIKEKNAEKIKDLTGQHFGKLTAIYPTEERSGSSVIWYCKCECGNDCYVSSTHLRRGYVQSCGCFTSFVGEEKISSILKNNDIKFERQKTFPSCRFLDTNALARFDFYLPDFNYLIEYDGIQHYKPIQFGGCTIEQAKDNFEKTKQHDIFKNKWCQENNIKLIRISYTQINDLTINDLLF